MAGVAATLIGGKGCPRKSTKTIKMKIEFQSEVSSEVEITIRNDGDIMVKLHPSHPRISKSEVLAIAAILKDKFKNIKQ